MMRIDEFEIITSSSEVRHSRVRDLVSWSPPSSPTPVRPSSTPAMTRVTALAARAAGQPFGAAGDGGVAGLVDAPVGAEEGAMRREAGDGSDDRPRIIVQGPRVLARGHDLAEELGQVGVEVERAVGTDVRIGLEFAVVVRALDGADGVGAELDLVVGAGGRAGDVAEGEFPDVFPASHPREFTSAHRPRSPRSRPPVRLSARTVRRPRTASRDRCTAHTGRTHPPGNASSRRGSRPARP